MGLRRDKDIRSKTKFVLGGVGGSGCNLGYDNFNWNGHEHERHGLLAVKADGELQLLE